MYSVWLAIIQQVVNYTIDLTYLLDPGWNPYLIGNLKQKFKSKILVRLANSKFKIVYADANLEWKWIVWLVKLTMIDVPGLITLYNVFHDAFTTHCISQTKLQKPPCYINSLKFKS